MASSSTNPPQGVTFGVELEMLVPYLFSDQADPAEGETRQVIRLSKTVMSLGGKSFSPENKVGDILRKFLRSHGVAMYEEDALANIVQALSPPSKWSLGKDFSVEESGFSPYRWVGMELRSPALLARDTASFAEIKRVVSLLQTTFRLRVNETTGLHVHVGRGVQPLPPSAVLRLTQFLWCADGTLSQLHPPERMINSHCRSIRHDSYLARRELDLWQEIENATLGGGQDVTPVSPPALLTNRVQVLRRNPTSFPALNVRLNSSRLQRLPPLRTYPHEDEGAQRRYRIITGRELTGREFRRVSSPDADLLEDEGEDETKQPEDEIANKPPMPVLEGLRALCQPQMYAKATRAVEEMSISTTQRANYNLKAYGFRDTGSGPRRMTIEFREAAGSLDPAWVAAWAKIASRIVEFCLEAQEDMFAEVLMRVVEAELAFDANRGVSRYDVVDLLIDLGLDDEAHLVEARILMGDKYLFWFPCVLAESHENDHPGATVMVPIEYED